VKLLISDYGSYCCFSLYSQLVFKYRIPDCACTCIRNCFQFIVEQLTLTPTPLPYLPPFTQPPLYLHPLPNPTHHAEPLLLVQQHGEDEGSQHAGSEGVVGVHQSSVLAIARGQGPVETGPEQPQEEGPWWKNRSTQSATFIMYRTKRSKTNKQLKL